MWADDHRSLHFISTVANDGPTITLQQDGDGWQQVGRPAVMTRTMLSAALSASWSHAFAVNQELRRGQRVQLIPAALREPGYALAAPVMAASGANLPAALAWI